MIALELGQIPLFHSYGWKFLHMMSSSVCLTCAQARLLGRASLSHILHKYGVHRLQTTFLIPCRTNDKDQIFCPSHLWPAVCIEYKQTRGRFTPEVKLMCQCSCRVHALMSECKSTGRLHPARVNSCFSSVSFQPLHFLLTFPFILNELTIKECKSC